MLKKMLLVLGIIGLFFGFGFSKEVNAVASCKCNSPYCETWYGNGFGVGGGISGDSLAFSIDNCPAKTDMYRTSDNQLIDGGGIEVIPFCKNNTGGVWPCHCEPLGYTYDIAAGDTEYYFEYIDKTTGSFVTTKNSAGPTNCSPGGNCCVCNDRSNTNVFAANNCTTGLFPNCNPTVSSWSGTSTNCSCGPKALPGFNYNTYDPLCSDKTSIRTDFGCVPIGMKDFVPWLLNLVFGIAGGIAFLLMAYGFILVATSGGDEKKIQGAKETITSAIVGLLVCIFSIFILRLIAVNILQIPGIN